jgi:hypothetical protein
METDQKDVLLIGAHKSADRFIESYTFSRDQVEGRRIVPVILPDSDPRQPVSAQMESQQRNIKAAVREYVQKHGTLDTLRIFGHGTSQMMVKSNESGTETPISVLGVLNRIHDLQEEMGMPIAKRIEFPGCLTFTALSDQDVKIFRTMSKVLGAEIVGSTGYVMRLPDGDKGTVRDTVISFKDGQVGNFTPASKHSGSFAAFISQVLSFGSEAAASLKEGSALLSAAWIGCHQGRSQQEGEECTARKKHGVLAEMSYQQRNHRIDREQAALFDPGHPDKLGELKIPKLAGKEMHPQSMLRDPHMRGFVFNWIDFHRISSRDQVEKDKFVRMREAAQQFVDLEERRTAFKTRSDITHSAQDNIGAPSYTPP